MPQPYHRTSEERYCLISHILSATTAIVYLLFLILAYLRSPPLVLRILLLSAVPFLLVTGLRHLIPLARPTRRNGTPQKKSHSFPSRHAYSAFFIATVFFGFSPLVSYLLFPAAILLSALRVMAGIHYPRDVVAGAFLGVTAAILLLILL